MKFESHLSNSTHRKRKTLSLHRFDEVKPLLISHLNNIQQCNTNKYLLH